MIRGRVATAPEPLNLRSGGQTHRSATTRRVAASVGGVVVVGGIARFAVLAGPSHRHRPDLPVDPVLTRGRCTTSRHETTRSDTKSLWIPLLPGSPAGRSGV